jgi:hypothetical protein
MLARSGRLPVGAGWNYEVKWDGFRAIVSTVDGFRVVSRRVGPASLCPVGSDRTFGHSPAEIRPAEP